MVVRRKVSAFSRGSLQVFEGEMMRLHRQARFVLVLILSLTGLGGGPFVYPVECQGGSCPTFVITPGYTIVTGPTLHVGTCPVVDGAYVLGDANIRIDARGETTGHCKYQLLSGSPPVCTVVNGGGNGEDKTVNAIAVRYFKPGNSTNLH